ncbi:MAG TPA: hypothetical protein VFY39_05995 [Gammaproteobacteria bacterium]|nr:hypothetical protein [Gammaproteobacteria bacterium]
MAGTNEGEGNRTAARRYNEAVRETVKKGKAGDSRPLSEAEQRELEKAEEVGKTRAKEFDPEEDIDFKKPAK